MKRLLLLLLFGIGTLSMMGQDLVSTIMDEVDQATKKSTVQMNISGKMLRFAAAQDNSTDKDMKELLQSIDKVSMVAGLRLNEKQHKLLTKLLKPFEELMTIVEEEQQIAMYTKEKKEKIEEFVLLISSGDNTVVLISISGNIDLKLLALLSEAVNIDGLEHLGKVEEKKEKEEKK